MTVRSRDAGKELVVEVADTGIGIPPELIGNMFLPFEQANQAHIHQFGGLGLFLRLSIELFAEGHDVDALLTEGGADGGRGVRLAGGDLELDLTYDFFSHVEWER